MKTVTVDQVIAWKPCGHDGPHNGQNYTRQRIEELFAGRASLTASDIAVLDILGADKLWALLHNEFLTDEQMHLLTCDFAERVVHLADDPRCQQAIDAKRAWLRDEITDDELAAAGDAARAARAAAGDAAGAAAWAAAWAARAAAWATARAARTAGDAAWAARAARTAGDAEITWQIQRIMEVLAQD